MAFTGEAKLLRRARVYVPLDSHSEFLRLACLGAADHLMRELVEQSAQWWEGRHPCPSSPSSRLKSSGKGDNAERSRGEAMSIESSAGHDQGPTEITGGAPMNRRELAKTLQAQLLYDGDPSDPVFSSFSFADETL